MYLIVLLRLSPPCRSGPTANANEDQHHMLIHGKPCGVWHGFEKKIDKDDMCPTPI